MFNNGYVPVDIVNNINDTTDEEYSLYKPLSKYESLK